MTFRKSPDWHSEALRLRADGVSKKEIARRCGKSPSLVRYVLNENGEKEKRKETSLLRYHAGLGGPRPSRAKPICDKCGMQKANFSRSSKSMFVCVVCYKPKQSSLCAKKTLVNRAYNKNNPEKREAHKQVERAIERGDLVPSCCEVCGSDRTHAHHDDYSKPLDVRWLCPTHHKAVHRELSSERGASSRAVADAHP